MVTPQIENIAISSLLPKVFHGMENTQRIEKSQVWLVPNLRFHRGCRICLQAESGGGKSSLLSFVYGNRNDYLGEIYYDDENIRHFDINKWCEVRMRHIALLPQEMRMFPELTVMQNLQIKNQITQHKTESQLLQLLEKLGVVEKVNDPLNTLSIGQQQRVAIVRTICQPFDFILLDEPVSHLDVENNKIAAAIIAEEAEAQGAGVISTSVGNPLLLDGAEIIAL
jgi:ABC-type lipoprotein export system ATPase subunit